MTASAFAAVHLSIGIPVFVAVAALVLGAATLRPRIVFIALLVVLSARTEAQIAELEPVDTRPVTAESVRLIADPRPGEGTWRGLAEIRGAIVMLEARAGAGGTLSRASIGDTLRVDGTMKGSVPRSGWAISRRLVGRIDADEVAAAQGAAGPHRWATVFREELRSGAASLSRGQQSLFTGLVFGDDRDQSAITADDFRAAGLGHLLAVSGQNVVFVVGLAAPVLLRIRSLNLRYVAFLTVLAAFGFITRFEPSVTRALAMAALVGFAANRGSPRTAIDVLPAAVLSLLLHDPLLGFALGFQLSVLATLGLMIVSPRLYEILSGPTMLRAGIAATAGAQLAVTPLLLATFGSVSVLAVPANVLAGPAAAFVMMWGLTGGVLATVAPPAVAEILHWPTSVAVGWIEGVASAIAAIPVAQFRLIHLGLIGVALGIGRHVPAAMRSGLLCVALLAPLLFPTTLPPGSHEILPGVTVVRLDSGHDVVQLERSGGASAVLEALRQANIGRVDLLVVPNGSRQTGRLVRTISARFEVVDIWAPPNHNIPGAHVVGDDPVAIFEQAMPSSSHGERAR